MKFIHCADLHLGAPLRNLPSEKSKIRSREMFDTFVTMVNYAQEHDVKAIIISGDLFDSKAVTKSLMKEMLSIIETANKVDFIYLSGNHDENVRFLEGTLPANFHLIEKTTEWTKFKYDNVTISGIDITRQKNDLFYDRLSLNDKDYNIVVLHGDFNEIKLDKLRNKRIDYLALGHIHIPDLELKKLDVRGNYAYSGSLDAHGFDELGPRGFFLLEIDKSILTRTFHPIAKRQYLNVEVDITGLNNHSLIMRRIEEQTASINKRNLITVILKGKYEVDLQKDVASIESKLNERFFFVRIKDQSHLDYKSIDFSGEVSLRSKFVLDVQNSDLPEDEKEKIIEYGIKALNGEEIEL